MSISTLDEAKSHLQKAKDERHTNAGSAVKVDFHLQVAQVSALIAIAERLETTAQKSSLNG
jgi:ABC-type enterochelin transport system substrate-binding protein